MQEGENAVKHSRPPTFLHSNLWSVGEYNFYISIFSVLAKQPINRGKCKLKKY